MYGYCPAGQITGSVKFSLTANATKAFKIYNTPQIQQSVNPFQIQQYKFCARSDLSDVAIQLFSWTSSIQCPKSYTSLQMVVSKYNQYATSSDYVWRVNAINPQQKLTLFQSDTDTRPGSC